MDAYTSAIVQLENVFRRRVYFMTTIDSIKARSKRRHDSSFIKLRQYDSLRLKRAREIRRHSFGRSTSVFRVPAIGSNPCRY